MHRPDECGGPGRPTVGPLLIDILVTLYHHLFDVQPPQPSRSSKFPSLTIEKGTHRILRSSLVRNQESIAFPFNKRTHTYELNALDPTPRTESQARSATLISQ